MCHRLQSLHSQRFAVSPQRVICLRVLPKQGQRKCLDKTRTTIRRPIIMMTMTRNRQKPYLLRAELECKRLENHDPRRLRRLLWGRGEKSGSGYMRSPARNALDHTTLSVAEQAFLGFIVRHGKCLLLRIGAQFSAYSRERWIISPFTDNRLLRLRFLKGIGSILRHFFGLT